MMSPVMKSEAELSSIESRLRWQYEIRSGLVGTCNGLEPVRWSISPGANAFIT